VTTYGLVDARVHLPYSPEQVAIRDSHNPESAANLRRMFGATSPFVQGRTVEQMIQEMDDAGVEKAVLITEPGHGPEDGRAQNAIQMSAGYPDATFDRMCAPIARLLEKYPSRFIGQAMLDPMGAMRAVRQLERSVKEFGFKAAAIMPSNIGLPPDHPLYYPMYVKCIELDIPLTINLGVPGPMRLARTQRPLDLDEILLTFPELKLVATHVGHPWHLEVIALMQRHKNFYLMTSAFSPKRLPAELLEYMDRRGRDKVMWATDYSLMPFDRTGAEGRELPIADDAKENYLRNNCLRVFFGE
jgi:predicted TIM-barrel fold metal-dependent hydrolase